MKQTANQVTDQTADQTTNQTTNQITNQTNQTTNEKSSFQKTTEILLPFLIYYIACNIVNALLWTLVNFLMQHAGETVRSFLTTHAPEIQGIISGLYMLAGLLFIGKTALREIKLTEKPRNPVSGLFTRIPFYLFLCIFSLTSSIGINILFTLTGFATSSESYNIVREQQFGTSFWIGLLVFGILSPLAEEALFRGIIFNRMKKYFPLLISILMSSILFGVYHGNKVQGVYAVIMGILIVFLYHKCKTFPAPLLFHSVANIGTYALTYRPEGYGLIVRPEICAISLLIAAICFIYLILPNRKSKILP